MDQFHAILGYSVGLSKLTANAVTAINAAIFASADIPYENLTDIISLTEQTLGDFILNGDDLNEYKNDNATQTNGGASDDPLIGTAGDDIIWGFGGNDNISGLSGNDLLKGGEGSDILDGGLGDDFSEGGFGNDTYYYSGGNDTYQETLNSNDTDQIIVRSSTGLTAADVDITFRSLDDLIIRINTGSELVIDNYFENKNREIETIIFETDNSFIDFSNLSNLTTFGTEFADNIVGATLENEIFGYEGNDKLLGNYLDDQIFGGNGSDRLEGDGGNDSLNGGDGDDVIRGGRGNDIIDGGNGNDILIDFEGTTTFIASSGNDIYFNGENEGTIVFDNTISESDIIFSRPLTDKFVSIGWGTATLDYSLLLEWNGNSALIKNQYLNGSTSIGSAGNSGYIRYLEFENTTIDLSVLAIDIEGNEDNNIISLQSYPDFEGMIIGGATAVAALDSLGYEINTYGGLDLLTGSNSSDILKGGAGDDYYTITSGHDIIEDISGNDTLILQGELIYFSSFPGFSDPYRPFSSDLALNYSYLSPIANFQNIKAIFNFNGDVTLSFGDAATSLKIIDQIGSTPIETISSYDINLDATNIDKWIFGTENNLALETLSGDLNGFINDVIISYSGDDEINSFEGDDYIFSGTGNDIIQGGEGNDYIYAHSGHDTANYLGNYSNYTISNFNNHSQVLDNVNFEGLDKLYGVESINFSDGTYDIATETFTNNGPVLINGTSSADIISGGSGIDHLYGYEGDDTLNGNDGDDFLQGGAGNDIIDGGNGIDTVSYENVLVNSLKVDLMNNESINHFDTSDNDTLANIENIIGSTKNDQLHGDNNTNEIWGGAGSDHIHTYGGDDIAHGGDGGNTFYDNGTGNNYYYGGIHHDWIDYITTSTGVVVDLQNQSADDNNDGLIDDILIDIEKVKGSIFDDIIKGDAGYNFIFGADGNDSIYGNNGNDKLYGNNGNDIVYGEDGNDQIYGGTGNNFLYGGSGSDQFYAKDGNDTIDGRVGSDTINYMFSFTGVVIDMVNGTVDEGKNTIINDTFTSIERVIGSRGDDIIYGDNNSNYIDASFGNDTVYGEGGNDTLQGSTDNDILYGGDGVDYLYGSNGDDVLESGAGADNIYGQNGADTFVFMGATAFLGVNNLRSNFKTTENDKIDISDVINQYDPLTDILSDFVSLTEVNNDTFLAVDVDGSDNGANYQDILKIVSQTGIDTIDNLEANGFLITS